MKKQDKFLIVGLLVILVVGIVLTLASQSRPTTTTLETEVIEFRRGEYHLMANQLHAVDDRGLPSEITNSGRVSMDGEDIYIIQTGDDVKFYVAANREGNIAYAEFPTKDEDLVDWSGARLLYIQDGWLVSAGSYIPGTPIRQQILNQMNMRGGTTSPIIFGDGRLYVPVYCYSPANNKCVFIWLQTEGAKVTSFAISETSDFSYIVLENVKMAGMTVPVLYIPISAADVEFLQACFKSLNGDPKSQCRR